jgi:hypothetical protein
MNKYALINNETLIVENIILWNGYDEISIPDNYYLELVNETLEINYTNYINNLYNQ